MSGLPDSCTTVLPDDVLDLLYDHYEAYVFTPGEGGDGKGVSGIDFDRAVKQIHEWLAEGYQDVRLTGIKLPREERAWHVLIDTRNRLDLVGLFGPPLEIMLPPWLLELEVGPRGRASALAERL